MFFVTYVQSWRRLGDIMNVAKSQSRRIPNILETESTQNASKSPADVFVSFVVTGTKYAIEVPLKEQLSFCGC